MPADFNNFKDIYRFLSPSELPQGGTVTKKSVLSHLMASMLSPSANLITGDEIIRNLEGAKINGTEEEIKGMIHLINDDKTYPFNDKDYYKVKKNGVAKKITGISGFITPPPVAANRTKTTAIATRSPYISPSKRGTGEIELFLNYIPTTVASNMVPYLDVEFEILKELKSTSTLSTPSTLRFLLGSADLNNNNPDITDADRALNQTLEKDSPTSPTKKDSKKETFSYSGMELFLMPQTLSNMNNLGSSAERLLPVKPFTPFMSIESFNITSKNAGAGDFVHKTAQLKIKVHDKARLSEISQFIRGAPGFQEAIIWTTYGWLTTRNSPDNVEDGYSKFINETMMVTDCWQTTNAQFSFDSNGVVSINIDLVNKGMVELQNASIEIDDESYTSALRDLKKITDSIKVFKNKIFPSSSGVQGFSTEIRAVQLLNSGKSGGFLNIDGNAAKEIQNLKTALKKSKSITEKEAKDLETALKKLYTDKDAKKGKTLKESVATAMKGAITGKFNKLSLTPDPFLAPNKKDSAELRASFFNDDLINIVSEYAEPTTEFKDTSVDSIMSFGKLFLGTIVQSIIAKDICDEVQVFFYALNDQCGPVSGHSVAEFPIDIRILETVYKEYLETQVLEGGNVTIEAFYKLIVAQFVDNRSIGYGMTKQYKPWNKDIKNRPEAKLDNNESETLNWFGAYGAFKQPTIEIYFETGTAQDTFNSFERLRTSRKSIYTKFNTKRGTQTEGDDDKKIIKRIHIYDKQNNPYGLLAKFMQDDVGWTSSTINKDKLKDKLEGAIALVNKENKDVLAARTDENIVAALRKINGIEPDKNVFDALRVYDTPTGQQISIKKNRKEIRDSITSTAPNIIIGTNGSMVTHATLASKTEGNMGAINLIRLNQDSKIGGAAVNPAGIENPNGLPLRTVPAQLTMTSKGCPIASCYQQFFIDFGTGTTLDNMYTTVQIMHSLAPGKFETSWTFAFTDGYSRYQGAPGADKIISGEISKILETQPAKSPKK